LSQDKTWINGKIRSLLVARTAALNARDSTKLARLKTELQREIRYAKREYAHHVAGEFKTSTRQSWKKLKNMLRINTKTNKSCDVDPDTLNQFYLRFEQESPPQPQLPTLSDENLPTLSVTDVIKSLRTINVTKSSGPDKIPGKMLKIAAYALGEPLCDLFNDCIREGEFPQLWKTSIIKPIPKTPAACVAKDYRPVALTSIVAKSFERATRPLLARCLNDTSQFAYQQRKSTEDALTVFLDIVTKHLDAKSKNYIRCLFVDFTSAFNTISPSTLIDNLNRTNLHGNLINLVYSFMTNRKQLVSCEAGVSAVASSSTGSPQGCVWSPLLYCIYVQDMPTPSCGTYHLIKYADDVILVELCHADVPSTLLHGATFLTNWFDSNNLILNAAKTKDMIISNKRDNPICSPIKLNSSCIELVESFTYLGTILDSKLSFKQQTEATITKARKRFYILKKLSSLGVPRPVIVQCYITFVECIFIYHLCTIYGHLSQACIDSINDIIKTARYLTGCHCNDIKTVYERCFKKRCLRMFTSNPTPLLDLDKLPSGRYRSLKYRVDIRRYSFRALAIKFMNSVFF